MITAIGTAKLNPKNSTKVISILAKDVVWELVETNERQQGVERVWVGQPSSGSFHFFKWTVYEHPAGAFNGVAHDVGDFTLIEDFKFIFD